MLQAIEKNDSVVLTAAVVKMKDVGPIEGCLDVCEMVPDPFKENQTPCYPMTLMAYAGYFARKDMLEFLISNGACKFTNYEQLSPIYIL